MRNRTDRLLDMLHHAAMTEVFQKKQTSGKIPATPIAPTKMSTAVKDLPPDDEEDKSSAAKPKEDGIIDVVRGMKNLVSDVIVEPSGHVVVTMRQFADPTMLRQAVDRLGVIMTSSGNMQYRDQVATYGAEVRFRMYDAGEKIVSATEKIESSGPNQTSLADTKLARVSTFSKMSKAAREFEAAAKKHGLWYTIRNGGAWIRVSDIEQYNELYLAGKI